MSTSYCTPQEAKERMGHAAAHGVDLEQRLAAACPAATELIDREVGRSFTAATATRTYRTPGHCHDLHLPDDLTALSTLKVDDDDDGTFETTIAASGYELDKTIDRSDWPFDVVRLLDRTWPSGGRRSRRIEITATFGWASVPGPINQACSLLAARIAQRPIHALFGTESFGDLGAASIRSIDPDVARMLNPYRRPQVA